MIALLNKYDPVLRAEAIFQLISQIQEIVLLTLYGIQFRIANSLRVKKFVSLNQQNSQVILRRLLYNNA